jgi:Domain of unknown function (DUF4389)
MIYPIGVIYPAGNRTTGDLTMKETSYTANQNRNIWTRGLFMLLLILACHISWTVAFIVTVIQFVMVLTGGKRNDRLAAFGGSLGRYLQQIVCFLTFASETMPFPFSDWPTVSDVWYPPAENNPRP